MACAGISTKLHLAVTGGNVNDVTVAPELVQGVYGRPVLADMWYDSDRFRHVLEANNNVPEIPGRKNRKVPIVHDEEFYKARGIIEQVAS